MKFEVVKDKKTVMFTNYDKCIPPAEELKKMKENGYSFRKDGKNITVNGLIAEKN